MKVSDLNSLKDFTPVNEAKGHTDIDGCYCCDLLSICMGQLPEGYAWFTVMNNLNTLAVASLTDCSVIILSAGVKPDDSFIEKARQEQINVYTTDLPVFEGALEIHNLL